MVAVTTREAYGAELPWQVVDANFMNLASAIDGIGADVLAEAIIAKDQAELAANTALNAEIGADASAAAAAASVASLSAPAGSTLISFITDGIGAVLRTVFDKLLETISIKDFGAKSDGVTDDSDAIAKANTRAGNRPLVFIGVSNIASPTTITAPIYPTLEQIFTDDSQVTIDNGLPVRPEWFGLSVGSIRRAIKSLPSVKGGIVELRDITYPHNGWRYGLTGPGEYIDKPAWLRGSKMPSPSNNCQRLENGTIIQGMVLAYADNVMFSDLGVDSGLDVCNQFFGGVAQEGLLRTYPDEASKAAALLRQGGGSHNVCSMTKAPLELVHAMILSEGHTGCRVTGDCISYYGYHGAVCKGNDLTFDSIHAYMNGGEGFIAKTDGQSTAVTTGLYGNSIKVYANGPSGTTPHAVADGGVGVMMNAENGSIDTVQIGSIQSIGHPVGFGIVNRAGHSVVGMQIGQIRTSNNRTSGVSVVLPTGASLNYSYIGSIISTLTPVALDVNTDTPLSVMRVGSITAKLCGVAAQFANRATVSIGAIIADTCTSGAVRFMDSARCGIDSLTAIDSSVFATDAGGLSPQLLNGWNSVGDSNEVFGVDFVSGGVRVRGLVSGGTTNSVGKLPFFARPSKVQRLTCSGMASGASTSVLVTIDPEGIISVNEYGGGIANVEGWLSLDCFFPL